MKFVIPFLMAVLPAACIAQSHSGGAAGVPSVAIPKTTEVLVIQTARQGITPEQIQQIVALMPAEIRATVKLYFEARSASGIRAAMAGAWSSWSMRRPRTRRELL